MVTYGLNIENERLILDKAKSKRDGVFTFRGVAYRVRQGKVTHFAVDRKILERAYGFNCIVGNYEWKFSFSARDALKAI